MVRNGLLGVIGATLMLSAAGLIGCNNSHNVASTNGNNNATSSNINTNRPGIVYYVNGKEVMERRFDTQEQFNHYHNSEEGKKEAEHYKSLNVLPERTNN